MTTPAPPQQQGQQPPPQQPPPPAPPAIPPQTLAAMALPLAGLLLTAASAALTVKALKLRFKLGVLSALFWLALLMVLSKVVYPNPPPVTGFAGAAGAQVSRANTARRAQFALAAANRVTGAMVAARARGEDVTAAGSAQVERERRYYGQHLDAMWQRAQAAMAIDMAAAQYGPMLGWLAKLGDGRTTAECRRASGKNFYPANPPDIGLPGVVHVGCRCRAVAPWPGAPLLAGTGPRYARAA